MSSDSQYEAVGMATPKVKKMSSFVETSVRSKKEVIGVLKAVEAEISALFEPGVTDRNDGISECLSHLTMKRESLEQEVSVAEEAERRAAEEYVTRLSQDRASTLSSWFSSTATSGSSAVTAIGRGGAGFGLSSMLYDTLNGVGAASVTSGSGSGVAATGSGGEQG